MRRGLPVSVESMVGRRIVLTRSSFLGARQKLNQAYVNGACITAAMFGLVSQSWVVFLLFLVVGLMMGLHSGGIRPDGRTRRRP